MIIWLNGGFGAGKTTLANELHRQIPDAVVYDPEIVGLMLWEYVPRNEDFQDLPSWRELVVATALSLRKHHAEMLIVPMSLIRDAYRDEIFDGLTDAGEEILHVFLHADPDVLKRRVLSREHLAKDRPGAQAAREWSFTRIDAAAGAAARQPAGTLVLHSDQLTSPELASRVLAAAGKRVAGQKTGVSANVRS